MWVLRDKHKIEEGYPKLFHDVFRGLPADVTMIKTIYEKQSGNIVIFSGNWKKSLLFLELLTLPSRLPLETFVAFVSIGELAVYLYCSLSRILKRTFESLLKKVENEKCKLK